MREQRVLRRPEAVAELRAAANGGSPKITGYAAVFNSYSQNLGGFVETIAPDAFNRFLGDPAREVLAMFNHSAACVLGARSSGTLTLSVDDIGLRFVIDPPDTTAGRDLTVLIDRRDILGSSFSFSVASGGDTWGETEQGYPLRTVTNVACIYDVGPVASPAYLGTTEADAAVALRSLASDAHPLADLIAAAARNELSAALKAEGEPSTPPPAATAATSLVLHRARLALAERTHPPTR